VRVELLSRILATGSSAIDSKLDEESIGCIHKRGSCDRIRELGVGEQAVAV